MAIAPVILRKWLHDGNLNSLAQELDVKFELPIVNTQPVFSVIEETQVKFFIAGGIPIGGFDGTSPLVNIHCDGEMILQLN